MKMGNAYTEKHMFSLRAFLPGLLTVGGNDQAYVYGVGFGEYWWKIPEDRRLLGEI